MEDQERRQGARSLFEDEVERRAFACLAEFAAGAGHELNNPLAVISARAQELLKDESQPDRRRALAAILAQTRVAYDMISSLRLFARPPQARMERLNARAFFEEWTTRERARIEVAEKSLVVESCDDLPADVFFQCDPAALSTALAALGKNAAEASASRGVVRFFGRAREDKIQFGVENDGAPLTDELKEFAFAPYFSGRRAGRGLGFGVPLARRCAELMNGRLFCAEGDGFEQRWWVELARLEVGESGSGDMLA